MTQVAHGSVKVAERRQRRRASSIQSVTDIFQATKDHCEKKELSIMTEFITINPVTLKFNRPNMELSFMKEHKDKYRSRYHGLMLFIFFCLPVLSIYNILHEQYIIASIKLAAACLACCLIFCSKQVYDNDVLLVITSSALIYLVLLSQILVEKKDGSVSLKQSQNQIGAIFFLFTVVGTIVGLRFIASVYVSSLTAALGIASTWIQPNVDILYTQIESTGYIIFGYFFYNFILIRKIEIQERRDFRLTKRLAAENVHVQMQMENFSVFYKGLSKKIGHTNNNATVSPGGVLSAGCRINASEIEILSTIGCGSYGDVSKGRYKATNVAIKKVRGEIKQDVLLELGAESSIMADLRHPNIVLFMGICLYPPMIVMEYCARGSVFNKIHIEKKNIDWSLFLRILQDAAQGMAFLHQHSPPIIHRDLKSLNLLLDENWRCKVSDFGLSKLKKINQKNNEGGQITGSIPWMAPEGLTNEELTEKSDVFSYGVIIFEILKKEMPYPQVPMQGIPHLVSKGKRPIDYTNIEDLPDSLCELVNLMNLCWSQKPKNRPDFETVIDIFEEQIYPKYFGDKKVSECIIFPREKYELENEKRNQAFLESLSFNINEKELHLGTKIGGGSYGAVYSGKWLGTDVAIKQLFINSLPAKVLKEFNKECDLMRQLRHPNIVLFLGSSAKPPNLFLVTELLSKGSLFDIYHAENRSTNIVRHYGRAIQVATDMARGMAYLHSLDPPLIHRDLKSPNIMVDSHWVSKIGDFGLSRVKDENKTMTKCGSPLWVAPEVLQGHRFGEGCDIYSFAIIVWEVLAWSEPYPDMSSKKVMKEVALSNLRPTIPKSCPIALSKLIEKCWQASPEDRPSFAEILEKLEYIDSIHIVAD